MHADCSHICSSLTTDWAQCESVNMFKLNYLKQDVIECVCLSNDMYWVSLIRIIFLVYFFPKQTHVNYVNLYVSSGGHLVDAVRSRFAKTSCCANESSIRGMKI